MMGFEQNRADLITYCTDLLKAGRVQSVKNGLAAIGVKKVIDIRTNDQIRAMYRAMYSREIQACLAPDCEEPGVVRVAFVVTLEIAEEALCCPRCASRVRLVRSS